MKRLCALTALFTFFLATPAWAWHHPSTTTSPPTTVTTTTIPETTTVATTVPSTTAPPTTTATTVVQTTSPPPVCGSPGELPCTGSDSTPGVLVGLALVGLGALGLAFGRRKAA